MNLGDTNIRSTARPSGLVLVSQHKLPSPPPVPGPINVLGCGDLGWSGGDVTQEARRRFSSGQPHIQIRGLRKREG